INLSVEAAMKAEFPFTAVVDGKIDVHAMVRGILRAEIDQCILSNSYDTAHTTREELEWIHWKAALLNWRIIKRRTEPNIYLVSAIESFIYHMMAQTKLLPREGKGSARRIRKFAGGINDHVIETFEKHFGQLSNGQLWLFAYHR